MELAVWDYLNIQIHKYNCWLQEIVLENCPTESHGPDQDGDSLGILEEIG